MLVELALRNLSRIKVRSVLAVIGIIIGVMAISSIGIFGESMKATVLENFKNVVNEVIVTPNYMHGFNRIDEKTVKRLESLPYAEKVIPIKSVYTLVEGREEKTYATVYGVDMKRLEGLLKVEKGSLRECVLGSKIADYLGVRVGSKVTINGKEFRVCGILKGERRFDFNTYNVVFVSMREFDRIFNEKGYTMVIVMVRSLKDVDAFKDAVERTVNRKEEKISVFEMSIIIERIKEIFGKMTIFLMAIAGVSLLVAGISILNIMLMSTLERTKEIGLMRAIGAYRETILKMFLLEAGILGVIGSIIGGFLSFLGGYALDMLLLKTAKYVFTPSAIAYVLLGIFFGIFTALVSALYPAWKASKLEPIQALRYE